MAAPHKKVLIAEDSSVIQNLAKKVLEFQKFEIEAAKNGRQVLEKLAATHFDVILLDINMPLMDGLECARQIRALPDAQKAATPLRAMTGNARNYTLEEFQAAGFNEYLPKPINFARGADSQACTSLRLIFKTMAEIKYTPAFLSKLEDIFAESQYFLRYEKGNFKSGYCILKDKRVVLVNKYFPLEGRINCLLDILKQIEIDVHILKDKSKELYDTLGILTMP